MNVIYLSSSCSEEMFCRLHESGITQKLPQAQKYHRLLMEGIKVNISGKLAAISVFPVNRKWTKQYFFPREEETVNGISYIYSKFANIPILKQLSVLRNAKREIRNLILSNSGKTVIICDILNQTLALAARQMGKKYGIPVVGIVTDVPGHTSGARRKTASFITRKLKEFSEKRCKREMVKFDAYLLLTEAMNDVVNLNQKPYIVIEGHADIRMGEAENTLCGKTRPKVILYAGGIHREFGIAVLVDAFVSGHFEGWELHIYGDGNYQQELQKISEDHREVKYFGVKPNSYIVQQQLMATLLVNPRLTDAEYVKYSFPSKTLECMISGTPLLTTRLPGMPKDYNDYVYLFDEESDSGFRRVLSEVLGKDDEELHEAGAKAKAFALTEKNNVKQASKLSAFLESL